MLFLAITFFSDINFFQSFTAQRGGIKKERRGKGKRGGMQKEEECKKKKDRPPHLLRRKQSLNYLANLSSKETSSFGLCAR